MLQFKTQNIEKVVINPEATQTNPIIIIQTRIKQCIHWLDPKKIIPIQQHKQQQQHQQQHNPKTCSDSPIAIIVNIEHPEIQQKFIVSNNEGNPWQLRFRQRQLMYKLSYILDYN